MGPVFLRIKRDELLTFVYDLCVARRRAIVPMGETVKFRVVLDVPFLLFLSGSDSIVARSPNRTGSLK